MAHDITGKLGPGLLLLAVLAGDASANPWTRRAGESYVNLSYWRMSTDSPHGLYAVQGTGLYAEVGVVDRWATAVIDWNVYRHNVLADLGSTSGVGDLRVGVTSGALVAPFRLAWTATAGLPVGSVSAGLGELLPVGSGDLSAELRLEAGHGWALGPVGFYGVMNGGYRKHWPVRGGPTYADEVPFSGELGVKLLQPGFDRVWLAFKVAGQGALGAQPYGPAGVRADFGVAVDADVLAGFHVGAQLGGIDPALAFGGGMRFKVYLAHER
jgi:hypothetical protein